MNVFFNHYLPVDIYEVQILQILSYFVELINGAIVPVLPKSGTIGNVGFSETLILCGLRGCKKYFFRFENNIQKLRFILLYCKTGRKKRKNSVFPACFLIYYLCLLQSVYSPTTPNNAV